MKVALISSSFAPDVGGVETHVRNVAGELAARGHQVEVWTADRGHGLRRDRVDDVVVHHLPIPLPRASMSGLAGFATAFPVALVAWLTVARRLRPDVLHVQCFGPNGVYGLLLSLLLRRPLVVSSHGETMADDHDVFARSAVLRRALVVATARARAVTGCSTPVLEDLRTRFRLRVGEVVPNGVHLADAAPADSDEAVPYVFAVGRIQHNKGFDLLVDAFGRSSLEPGVRLLIGGTGTDLPLLRELLGSADPAWAGRVELLGRLEPDEVARLMSGAGVVAVPSRREAFGIVVLEAWRARTPLVAADVGGPRELVEDGVSGLLVEPEDPGALAVALERVLSDPALARRLADGGWAAVQRYTWSDVTSRYERIYRAVARDDGPRPASGRVSGADM